MIKFFGDQFTQLTTQPFLDNAYAVEVTVVLKQNARPLNIILLVVFGKRNFFLSVGTETSCAHLFLNFPRKYFIGRSSIEFIQVVVILFNSVIFLAVTGVVT